MPLNTRQYPYVVLQMSFLMCHQRHSATCMRRRKFGEFTTSKYMRLALDVLGSCTILMSCHIMRVRGLLVQLLVTSGSGTILSIPFFHLDDDHACLRLCSCRYVEDSSTFTACSVKNGEDSKCSDSIDIPDSIADHLDYMAIPISNLC